ncbi:RNA polymerase RpoN-/SigL-like sigma 54 subunit [Bacillus oleivorans]|uniref:RNA polymerase RpoN-/SigL-like sigma 54 subunit n=1 Tax=Bacillus oleivorans TaxID=1448271 RepID=A0A285CY84_9BACI|nr:RNA polymerase factor sigma-54 [Bacillus oleivorans]SNX72547.1 RNA polymerase RpoN-/SigL-like sigma 54 subunit [Bacillus oleivorans]
MIKSNLVQTQSVKLTMTHELRQAIELLQFSSQELIEYLEEKALENPLIKLISPKKPTIRQDSKNWIEQICCSETSLADFLIQQLSYLKLSPAVKTKVVFLIHCLDENGYLTVAYDDILETYPAMTVEEWDYYLSILHGLEPTGVGARNLQECIVLQMKKKGFAKQEVELIETYFDSFAHKKWTAISQKLSIPIRQIQELADQIATLDPKPGSRFAKEISDYVTPDCVVLMEKGEWTIRFVEDHLPKVQLELDYYHRLIGNRDPFVQDFLKRNLSEYHWLIKSIESRKSNLKRIILAVLKKQESFLKYGRSSILPLTMREIAAELNIHESTVSRAVRDKYIQTPHGTIRLKSLFSAKVGDHQDEQSAEKVKQMILQIMEKEDKLNPLSDQQIAEQLSHQSIAISRRTVAKYRDQLGILPSLKRKKFS